MKQNPNALALGVFQNAMFAMLRAVANHNKTYPTRIQHVLCPGLGTLTGAMSLQEAARQMALAYRNFHHPTTNTVWHNLKKRHQEIIGGRTSK